MGDGCLLMPEAPPFPFNSAGTLYMHPAPLTSLARATRSNTNGVPSQGRRNEPPASNSTINSSSSPPPPSKDSDETNNTSTDEQVQGQQLNVDDDEEKDLSPSSGIPQPCSIADAPLKLVKSDGLLNAPSTGNESSPCGQDDEQQLKKNKNIDDDESGAGEERNREEN
jgi:hypothetical protein